MQTYMLDHVVGMRTPLDENAVRVPDSVSRCRHLAVSHSNLLYGQESADMSSLCQGIQQWPRQHHSRHSQGQLNTTGQVASGLERELTHECAFGASPDSNAVRETSRGAVLFTESVHGAGCRVPSSECSCDTPLNRSFEPHLRSCTSSEALGGGGPASEACGLHDCACHTESLSMARESTPLDRRSTLSNEHFPRWLGAERMQRITNAVAAVFNPAHLAPSSRRRRSSSQGQQAQNSNRSGGSSCTDNPWRGAASGVTGRAAGLEETSSKNEKRLEREPKRSGLSSRLTRAFGWNTRMHMVRLRFCSREIEDSYKHNFYSNKAHINAIEQAIIIFLVG